MTERCSYRHQFKDYGILLTALSRHRIVQRHISEREAGSIERFELSVRRSKLPEAQNQSSISNERLFTRTRLRLPLLEMICEVMLAFLLNYISSCHWGGFAATHGSVKLYPQLPFSPEDSLKSPVQLIVSPERSLLVPTEEDEVRLNAPVISLKLRHAAQTKTWTGKVSWMVCCVT